MEPTLPVRACCLSYTHMHTRVRAPVGPYCLLSPYVPHVELEAISHQRLDVEPLRMLIEHTQKRVMGSHAGPAHECVGISHAGLAWLVVLAGVLLHVNCTLPRSFYAHYMLHSCCMLASSVSLRCSPVWA